MRRAVLMPDISRFCSGNFYVAIEREAFRRIAAPWCLSYHPASPPSAEEALGLAGVRPTDSGVVLAVRRVVSQWYHAGMGMTLRTSEKQTEALRRQALAEGRSMQAVALSAIDEYIERRAHQTEVNAVLDKVIERERGVLRRLADT